MKSPDLIFLAIPVFFVLIGIELLIVRLQKRFEYYRFNDTINDLSLGITDQVVGAFLKSTVFVGYLYLYKNHRLFEIPATQISMWILCLVFYDMMYYWAHRMSHTINIMWGSHIAHHSSEEYNLSVALRQGAFQGCFFWIFYLPLAFAGFPPFMFVAMAQVDTLYQFWIHTRTIGKLGPVEWIMNTPSHHRVHHGKNPKYIDKNHAGILIIWDRLFGTFQVEEEEPVYGTVKPLRSWNPVWGNIHYWIDLAVLAWKAPRLADKFLVWFMPPAWRPRGLESSETPRHLTAEFKVKYDPPTPPGVSLYVMLQFVVVLVLTLHFLKSESALSLLQKCGLGGFIILSLAAFGGLLEARCCASRVEIVRQVLIALGVSSWAVGRFGVDSRAGMGICVGAIALSAFFIAWLSRYRDAFQTKASEPEDDGESAEAHHALSAK